MTGGAARRRLDRALDKVEAHARKEAQGVSSAELSRRIAQICDTLKGPGIDNCERLALNRERHVFREILASRTGPRQ